MYIESCVRVTQPDDHWSKVMGSNCIGYPIVMLGFGFKVIAATLLILCFCLSFFCLFILGRKGLKDSSEA